MRTAQIGRYSLVVPGKVNFANLDRPATIAAVTLSSTARDRSCSAAFDSFNINDTRWENVVGVTLKRQHGNYTVAQLPVLSPIPRWCDGAGFVSVSRGDNELSVICRKDRVPARVRTGGEWVCFKLEGPLPSRGAAPVLAIMQPVTDCGIEIFAVSTFGGDYIFMPNLDATASIDCLTAAGHRII